MDGNEDGCPNCKQIIKDDEQHYKCDLCVQRIHKNCATLSGSEIKCMPLQKRVLILVCLDCKKMMSKTPLLIQLIEEMKNELTLLKEEVSDLKMEIKAKKNVGETIISERSFSEVIKNGEKYKAQNNSQSPSLIIKPKKNQSSEKTKNDLKRNIQPNQLNVGIKNIRETKQGNIVIKCTANNDIEKLKQAAENCLGDHYIIETLKLNSPRMKIVGYSGEQDKEELEQVIRQQNTWINEAEKMNITFIKKIKNKNTSTIFFECSSALYWKMMSQKKIFIGWERYSVYENLNIHRCFKCQEYYHKIDECKNEVTCEYCAGNHESNICTKQTMKCKNCFNANDRYKTKYNTCHASSDPECPTNKYHLNLLRSRIDYGR